MMLNLLFTAPLVALMMLIAVFIALTFHEFCHAFVAHRKGDPTAEQLGRLTLNPIAHIDPVGMIPFLLFGFGWAKPVPFNPYNLKNPAVDALHIALAGPFSNLFLAFVAGIFYRFAGLLGILNGLLPGFLIFFVLINIMLFFFNLIPIHPLDGSKILDVLLIRSRQQKLLLAIKQYGPQALLFMVILSIFTNIDAFFFIRWPAEWLCSGLLAESCYPALNRALIPFLR
jgi:Zn-dependent protease